MKLPVKLIIYSYMSLITICKGVFILYFILLGKYMSMMIFKNHDLLPWIISTFFVWIILRYLMPFIYILLTPLRFVLVTLIYRLLVLFRRRGEIMDMHAKNYQLNISNNFVENMVLWIVPGVIFFVFGAIRSVLWTTIALYVMIVLITYVDLTIEYTEVRMNEKEKEDHE